MNSKDQQIKNLLESVFEKAKRDSAQDSTTALAQYISNEIENSFHKNLSYKTLLRNYNTFVLGNSQLKSQPHHHTLNLLSKYVGKTSFADFITQQEVSEIQKTDKFPPKRRPVFFISAIGAVTLTILGFVLLPNHEYFKNFPTQSFSQLDTAEIQNKDFQCMYWNKDHFQLVDCHSSISPNPFAIIARNNYLLENFKEIRRHDTLTEYSIGRFWYNKDNGKLYIFSAEGKNPESGKELHPISEIIFYKYLKK